MAPENTLMERSVQNRGILVAESQVEKLDAKDDLVHFPVRDSLPYRFFKRLLDITFSLTGILLFLPLMIPLAILIRLESPGSFIFRQIRVGKNRRHFVCYKFRSMVPDAEERKEGLRENNEASGAMFKIQNDPRITQLGSFLRRSSLDELPQLFNVLKGDMSIVGPRPQIPSEVEQYEPWHYRRLEVQPGITCLWQISGRSSIGFNEWMRLDSDYVQHRGFFYDMKIILLTLPAIIARKGAY